MAAGINRVVLVGRLTRDVEVRRTTSGVSVASFTVAVDRHVSSQNQQQGNQPTADFISCVAWRQSADFLGNYARKGALVGVEGRIQTRNYTNQQGQKVYVTEVLADSVQLLESRNASQNRQDNNSFSSYNQAPLPQDPYENSANNNAPSQPADNSSDQFNTGPALDISSDDLPF